MYIVLVLERRLEKSYINPKKQLLSLHVVLVSPGVSRLGCSLSTVHALLVEEIWGDARHQSRQKQWSYVYET
jgi:hypothetical protein